MRLDVISTNQKTWYANGLDFTCTQCGNCCTGGPGYVWISKEEIVRLGVFLKLTPEEVVERYCRKIDGKFSLRENIRQGMHDCVFLKEDPAAPACDDNGIPQPRRVCSVYSVRPLQCRTWPFWPENLRNRQGWDHAAKRCHGMNQGRHFTVEQIHAVRDAAQWPENAPSSGK